MFFWALCVKQRGKQHLQPARVLAPPPAGRGSGPAGGSLGEDEGPRQGCCSLHGLGGVCPFSREKGASWSFLSPSLCHPSWWLPSAGGPGLTLPAPCPGPSRAGGEAHSSLLPRCPAELDWLNVGVRKRKVAPRTVLPFRTPKDSRVSCKPGPGAQPPRSVPSDRCRAVSPPPRSAFSHPSDGLTAVIPTGHCGQGLR